MPAERVGRVPPTRVPVSKVSEWGVCPVVCAVGLFQRFFREYDSRVVVGRVLVMSQPPKPQTLKGGGRFERMKFICLVQLRSHTRPSRGSPGPACQDGSESRDNHASSSAKQSSAP